jgi:two-component system response regulator RegX3
VRALLRRAQESSQPDESEETVRFGPFTLSMASCVLKRGQDRVPLSARSRGPFYLAVNPGKPHPPEEIYNAVWKSAYGDLTTVAVYVQRLRKKIEEDPATPRYIETVFGMGYRFNQEGDAAP